MSLIRAREICKEMLHQRGYSIKEEKDERVEGEEIGEDGGGANNLLLAESTKSSSSQSPLPLPKTGVIFHDDDINVESVKIYISIASEHNLRNVIVVYNGDVTPKARMFLHTSKNPTFETFLLNEVQYNPTKHRLVPKHEALEKEKREDFKKRYGKKIPEIKTTDPISRFLGFTRGDVIKITRKNNNGEQFITYRIVK